MRFKIPKCKFQSNCAIDIVMRRMCAFCRLNKCIECGMKKVSSRTHLPPQPTPDTHTNNYHHNHTDQIDHNNQTDHNEHGTNNYYIKEWIWNDEAKECRRMKIEQNRNKRTYDDTMDGELVTMHDILYALDTKCVEEIRNIIRLSKMLIGFNHICNEDRIKLVKHSCIQIYTMRSAAYYDVHSESWNIKLDGRNTVMLRLENIRTNSESVYSRLKEYLKVLKYEMDSDHRVLDLMTAIVLFNPDHDDLVDKETIKMEQKIYMYLLKRYLHLKYSTTCEANGRFLNLLNTFTDLFYLENRVRQNFLSFRANQFHPVINPDFNDTKRHKIDHKVITIDSESAPAIETRNLL
ncbi:unnamed protein product [Medioppia subpectinata]|uniref:NR LBD domain-containing protein n=1 Tax=Medioppia subpectinata TaxID=1979941 RepID=A0A7R9KWM8_9ACAR|nr:unnamed protein product [Medioppia subpectinata]CAG2111032.1 unnamed protein product [Medioppia subpectinata]